MREFLRLISDVNKKNIVTNQKYVSTKLHVVVTLRTVDEISYIFYFPNSKAITNSKTNIRKSF